MTCLFLLPVYFQKFQIIIQNGFCVGVLQAKPFTHYFVTALVKGFGLGVLALGFISLRQIVDGEPNLRMRWAQIFFMNG